MRELYWKLTVIILILLGLATLVPWSSSRNNVLGYPSTCTFAPFATMSVFGIAVGVRVA